MAFNLDEIRLKITADANDFHKEIYKGIEDVNHLAENIGRLSATMRLLNAEAAAMGTRFDLVTPTKMANLQTTLTYMKEMIRYQKDITTEQERQNQAFRSSWVAGGTAKFGAPVQRQTASDIARQMMPPSIGAQVAGQIAGGALEGPGPKALAAAAATTGATSAQLAALKAVQAQQLALGAASASTGATPAQLAFLKAAQTQQAILASSTAVLSTGATSAQLAALKTAQAQQQATLGLSSGATAAQLAALKAVMAAPPGTTGATAAQLAALGLAAPTPGKPSGPTDVERGLHPYYLMHQLHTAFEQGGAVLTHAVAAGLSEVSQLVGQGVRQGMADIGQQISHVLKSTLGFGGPLGQGIGSLGNALGGGISRYGAAYAQGQGGMLGAGVSGVATAATAGAIFGPLAAVTTGLAGAVNVGAEFMKMRIDTGLAAMATGFNLAMSAATAFGATLSELTEKFVVFGAQMETNRVVITAFAQDSGQMFSELQKLSREMPLYSFNELTEQMKVLVAESVPLDQVGVMLRKLGDIAHGDEHIFHRASLAIGEIFAQGNVTSQRIRQLASIGVGTGDLAAAMGLDEAKFMNKLRAGEVSVDVLIQAINNLTAAGGRFAGQNAKQLDTVAGQWQRLRTIIDQTFGLVGESLLKKAGLKEFMSNISDWFITNFKAIEEAAIAVFERMRVAGQVVAEFITAAWEGFKDTIGASGKSLTELLPSLEQMRQITSEILQTIVGIGKAIADIIKTGIKNLPQMDMDLPGMAALIQAPGSSARQQAFEQFRDLKKNLRERFEEGSPEYDQAMALVKTNYEEVVRQIDTGQFQSGISGFVNKLRADGIQSLDELEKRLDGFMKNFRDKLANPIASKAQVDAWMFGPFRETMPSEIAKRGGLSPMAKKFIEEVERREEGEKGGGGSPWEQWERSQKAVMEIRGRMAAAALLPLGGVGVDIKDNLEKAQRGEKDAFFKLAKGVKPLTDMFPPAAFQYSSQAQDTINRSQFDNKTLQQEVRDILIRSEQEQKRQTEIEQKVADALQALRNEGFKLAEPAAGID